MQGSWAPGRPCHQGDLGLSASLRPADTSPGLVRARPVPTPAAALARGGRARGPPASGPPLGPVSGVGSRDVRSRLKLKAGRMQGCGCWRRICLLPPQPLLSPRPLCLSSRAAPPASAAGLRAAPCSPGSQIAHGAAFPPLVTSSLVQQQLVEITVSEERQTQSARQISNEDKLIK